MNREKHFHPLAALHLLRKTLLVYLLPLVQVLFDRNWDALRAALRQELVLLFFISAVCWAVYYGGRWQVDAEGTVHVSWRLGVRLDRALRAEGLAALMLEQPLLYRLTGACRVVLYPVGQTKTITLYLTRQQAEELADVLLPVTDPLWHAPKGGEKLAFTVLGANGLATLILWWFAIHQTQSYAPDAQTAALAQLGQLAAFAARWLPLGTAWLLVLAGNAVLHQSGAQRFAGGALHRLAHRHPAGQPGRACTPVRDAAAALPAELRRPTPLPRHMGAALLPGICLGRGVPPGAALVRLAGGHPAAAGAAARDGAAAPGHPRRHH